MAKIGKLQRFVKEIERCDDEDQEEHMSSMGRRAAIKQRKKDWITQAVDAGYDKKALSAVLKKRKLEGRIEALVEELEPDQHDLFDDMEAELETEPVVAKAKKEPKGMPGADAPGSMN